MKGSQESLESKITELVTELQKFKENHDSSNNTSSQFLSEIQKQQSEILIKVS
jgi:hypothetical protein